MISLVVPTHNRAHTLRLVAPSYYQQEKISEIIFVDDAGDDETAEVIETIAAEWPRIKTLVLRNPTRVGASQSRNVGVAASTNEFILFCDDDEYMEPGYAATLLCKLDGPTAAAVSGRRVYLQEGESPQDALRRFGHGLRRAKPFRAAICEYVNGAIYEGDIELPFTNAIILTRKSLLKRFPFDGCYVRGNGYREETDYQMNLYVNGYRIRVTNDVHSFHLPPSMVKTGGQRTRSFSRIYWSIFYTRYFFAKYYDKYAERMGLWTPSWLALYMFAIFVIYREYVRPPLYTLAMLILRRRACPQP
jgi:glycosyltransferase involved in cell wall biosynthesis